MNLFKASVPCILSILSTQLAYAANEVVGVLTTLATTAAGAGTTVMVVTLMDGRRSSFLETDKAEKLAEIFIRDNSLHIDQDLALGEGKTINELAAAFEIKSDMRLQFGQLLKINRAALLSIATLKNLTPRRAGEFMRFVADKSENDSTFKPFMLEFRKKYRI